MLRPVRLLLLLLLLLFCIQQRVNDVNRCWTDTATATASHVVNPLEFRGSYSATSIIWSWYTDRWWVGRYICHLVQRGGDWAGPPHVQIYPRCTECNRPLIDGQCTNQSPYLLYNGPLLCGFNVSIKGLKTNLDCRCLTSCYTRFLRLLINLHCRLKFCRRVETGPIVLLVLYPSVRWISISNTNRSWLKCIADKSL